MEKTFGGLTAEQWKDKKLEMVKKRNSLLNDGAVTGSSYNVLISRYTRFINYAKNGGAVQAALFDLEGNLIPGKWIETTYGFAYLGKNGKRYTPSQAVSEELRVKNNAKKGFYEGEAVFRVDYDEEEDMDKHYEIADENIIRVLDNGLMQSDV